MVTIQTLQFQGSYRPWQVLEVFKFNLEYPGLEGLRKGLGHGVYSLQFNCSVHLEQFICSCTEGYTLCADTWYSWYSSIPFAIIWRLNFSSRLLLCTYSSTRIVLLCTYGTLNFMFDWLIWLTNVIVAFVVCFCLEIICQLQSAIRHAGTAEEEALQTVNRVKYERRQARAKLLESLSAKCRKIAQWNWKFIR